MLISNQQIMQINVLEGLFNESGMHIAFNCYLNLINTGLLVIVVVLDRLNDPGSSALNNASH